MYTYVHTLSLHDALPTSTMTNEADVSGYGGEAFAGNDEIRTGTGHDIIAGEAFTFLSGNATANSSATATAGEEGFGLAMAGNDLLVADKGDTAEIGRANV